MEYYLQQILRMIERMGPSEWILVLAAVIVVGLTCMRGFGSRSNY